jgi:hypothetical protein
MTFATAVRDAVESVLAGSAIGQEIERQAVGDRNSERVALGVQIGALRQKRLEGPPRHPDHVDGFRLYAESVQQAQFRFSLDHQISTCERRLRDLADPLISEFIEEMSVMQEEERRTQILFETDEELGPLGNPRLVTVASTAASMGERLAAIRAAREAAEALKLRVGIDVAKELQKLRDGLPPIEMRPVS